MRRSGGLAHLARVALSAASLGLAVTLLTFHGWLLWLRLTGGQILDPEVALRWGAAVLLLSGLLILRRLGVPLFWGRKALVFWALVILLHWSAAGPLPETASPSSPAGGPPLLFVLPAPTGALLLTLAVLWAVLRHRRWNRIPRPLAIWPVTIAAARGALAAGFWLSLSARPPPVAFLP